MRRNKRQPRKLQRTTTINITVTRNGQFDYTDEYGFPAYYHGVKQPTPGEKVYIIWWAEDPDAKLAIAFKDDSPCESAKFRSKGGFVRATVRGNAARKAYDYGVVYSVGGHDYTDDPQIIIN